MTELGAYLKEQREALGVSLEQVQSTTKIQKRYLLAIEEGEYDKLPGAFYARAFIKTYAEALGLDVDEVFSTYRRDLPEPEAQPAVELSRRATYSKSTAPKKSVAKRWIPNIIIIALIVGIGVGIWWFIQNLGNSAEPSTSSTPEPKVTVEEKEAPEEKTEEPAEKPAEEPKEEEKEEVKKPLSPKTTVGQDVTYEIKTDELLDVKVAIKKDANPSPFVGIRDTSLEGPALAPDHISASDKNPMVVEDAKTNLIRIRVGSIKGIEEITVNGQALKLDTGLMVQNIYVKKVAP